MSKGLIFWIIMLLWFLCLIGAWFFDGSMRGYAAAGGTVLHFLLFLLLGWQVYGAPVK